MLRFIGNNEFSEMSDTGIQTTVIICIKLCHTALLLCYFNIKAPHIRQIEVEKETTCF